jgi:glycosyltransferase involved in cell wall biosynthesis
MELMTKKTILLLSDHQLSTSGVGTQARWLVSGLIETGKYSFRCFGGAIKHDNYDTVVVNPDFIIKPTNGFGDRNLLRKTLAQVKPDALMLFTDPRFFTWVWEMEDEIHQICPITYWHLWDNAPWPEFNRPFYESTDLINCINYPTYEMVKERFPEKTNYIPHAVPTDLYGVMTKSEIEKFKTALLGRDRLDHFTPLFVGRNARRKMPSDVIKSWRMFLDKLQEKHGHQKATLVLHTDPLDQEGTNLFMLVDLYGVKDSVVFSKERIGFNEMKTLYNVCDTVINRSSAEGFGLPILESIMCGKPPIVIKTGGLTRQVEDPDTGEQFGIGLKPDVQTLMGNHMVPYIFEDFVSHETFADALMKMYEMGPEGREALGKKAMERASKEYDLKKVISDWDDTLTSTIDRWQNDRKSFDRWSMTEL